jgi:hypothetical protein
MATLLRPTFYALASLGSNTDATSYATASITPTNGGMILAFVTSFFGGTPAIPTLSGTNGLNTTWTQLNTATIGSDLRLTGFWGVASSGTAGVLTFDFGAETELAAVWHVLYVTNVNLTTPVIATNNVKHEAEDSVGNWNVTLPNALTSSANIPFGVFSLQKSTGLDPRYDVGNAALTLTKIATDGIVSVVVTGPLTMGVITGTTGVISHLGLGFELNQDGTGVSAGGGGIIRAGLSGGMS